MSATYFQVVQKQNYRETGRGEGEVERSAEQNGNKSTM